MWLKLKIKHLSSIVIAIFVTFGRLHGQTSPENNNDVKIGLGLSVASNVHTMKFVADANNSILNESKWTDLNGLLLNASIQKKTFSADLQMNFKEVLFRLKKDFSITKDLNLGLGIGVWNYGHDWLNSESDNHYYSNRHFGQPQWGVSYTNTEAIGSFLSAHIKYYFLPQVCLEASYQYFFFKPGYERTNYYYSDNWQDPGKNVYSITHPVTIGVKWEFSPKRTELNQEIHINKGDERTKIIYQ